MVVLSDRLKTIANKIPKNSKLADIGSDHALLPVYLAQKEIITFAVAGEVNPGPLEAAKRQVEQANLSHMIQVRSGDGLSVIEPKDAEVITIAGMGGALITQILTEGISKLEHVHQLVLQPNVGEEGVRRWLYDQGWYLIEEDILIEDDKIYEVLNAVKVEGAGKLNRELYDASSFTQDHLFRMGPYLLRHPTAILLLKWEREINKLQKICSRLALSNLEASKLKLMEFQEDIAELKEVLLCLQKGKP